MLERPSYLIGACGSSGSGAPPNRKPHKFHTIAGDHLQGKSVAASGE